MERKSLKKAVQSVLRSLDRKNTCDAEIEMFPSDQELNSIFLKIRPLLVQYLML